MEKKKIIIIVAAIIAVIGVAVGVVFAVQNSKAPTDVESSEYIDVSGIPDIFNKDDTDDDTDMIVVGPTTNTDDKTSSVENSTTTEKPTLKPTETTSKEPVKETEKPTSKPSTTSKPESTTKAPVATKPSTTKPNKPSGGTGVADINTGIGWDGKPIVYYYPDGTTGSVPKEGAEYEYEEGIWRVIDGLPSGDTSIDNICDYGCGKAKQECDVRIRDWHCDKCNKDIKAFECHPMH